MVPNKLTLCYWYTISLTIFFIEHAGELRIFVLREKNEWSNYTRSNSHLGLEMRKAEQRAITG